MQIERERVNLKFFGIFLILVTICVGCSFVGEMFLPGRNAVPFAIRTALAVLGLIVVAIGSERLVACQFGNDVSLGLQPSLRSLKGFFIGGLGALLFVALIVG